MSLLLETPHLAIATSLEAALEWRRSHPEATVLAGGTERMGDQALEHFRPQGYLHIGRIPALQEIHIHDDHLHLGAAATLERLCRPDVVAALPMLAQVAASIGTPQARRRGTVGGNLAGGLPDRSLAPALLALGCEVVLQAAERSERRLPLETFLQGRGLTALAGDELLTGLRVRRQRGPQHFSLVGPRGALVYPTVATALVVDPQQRQVALGIGNAAPTAIRAREAERWIAAAIDWPQRRLPAGAAETFGQQAAAACSPIDDVQASAAYRRHAVAVMARRLLEQAFAAPLPSPSHEP
ncbi:MAG: FAD binding domain-containing protein [Synechococcus sp.]|nr:FAD binding domain-containing protein [Synechococcus sp.]